MSIINVEVDKAIKDVRTLIAELNTLKSAINGIQGVSSKAFKTLTERVDKLEKELRQANSALKTLTVTTRRHINEMKKMEKQTKKNVKSSKALGNALRLVGLAGTIALIRKYTKVIFNQIKVFDGLKFAITQTKKEIFDINQSYVFLGGLTRDFGVELKSTTERWLKFSEAAKQSGISLRETQDIFRSMTKAGAVLGLNTQELSGVYLALEQMLSKGKVTTEELRRQLGERLPGAMGIMAASMNVTITELDKMMKKGEVLSAEVLPNFAKAMERAYGIENVNRVETLNSKIGRLKGAWDSVIITFTESRGLIGMVFSDIINLTTNAVKWVDKLFASTQRLIQILQTEEQEGAIKRLRDRGKESIDTISRVNAAMLKGQKDNLRDRAELDKLSNKEQTESVKKQSKVLEEAIAERTAKIIKLENQILVAQKEIALREIPDLEKDIKERETLLTNAIAAVSALKIKGNEKTTEDYDSLRRFEYLKETLPNEIALLKADLDARKLILQESRKVTSEGDDSGTGTKKKVKFAQDFVATNRIRIAQLKQEVALNKELASTEGATPGDRDRIAQQTEENLKEIARLEKEDRDVAILNAAEKERLKWVAALTKFEEGSEQYLQQKEESDKGIAAANDRAEEELLISGEQFKQDLEDVDVWSTDTKIDNIVKSSQQAKVALESERDTAIALKEEEIRNMLDGSIKQTKALEELEQLKVKYFNLELERQIKLLEVRKALAPEDEKAYWQGLIDSAESLTKAWEGSEMSLQDYFDLATQTLGAIQGITDAIFNTRIDRIDAEIDAETAKYDKLLELAKNDEAETKIIERNKQIRLDELAKKKRKEQIKQAKFDKAIAIQQATINTAVAVTAAAPNAFLMAATAVLGAIEIATIAATPIPAFATGGIMGYDGVALINDGGQKEYVERNGQILSTNNENALVNLQKGDIIHKDYDSMIRKSMVMNGALGGSVVDSENYDAIENAIDRGFKKAKINNNISVMSQSNSYENEMNTWN
tara:strand:- start:1171 stop:4179 length:3009 start_codon:yes stop_codon:yes gene_type:complete